MSEENQVPTGYKKTELGEIPEEWEIVKINDCCDVKTGGTPSTKNKDYWDGNIPWMSSGEINKKFVYSTEKKITQQGLENSNARILPADSVMVALNGQGKTRGSVAVLKILSTCNQSLACIVPDQKITHYLYLFYNLQSRYSEIRNITGDTGREGLNLRIIKDINVPLPRLPEQHKIASILSKVDEQIEQTEQIIAKTELLKKGLMQKLLTKGIGHTKFKKTELGEIPEEWDIFKLGDKNCTKKITQGPNPNYSLGVPSSNYRILKTKDLYDYGILYENADKISKEIVDNFKNFILEDGDVLVAIVGRGSIGKSNIFEAKDTVVYLFTRALGIIRVNKELLFPLYVHYFLQSSATKKVLNNGIAGSTGQEVLQTSYIKYIKIPVPPLPEQQQIVSILSKVYSQIQDNQSYLTKLQELKKGLMQDLLTGKVRVCV